jgi:uncharacterized membrane protein YgdD (TMEM256/DUF423 family)
MSYRFSTLSAGVFGLTGVALGALGAHGPLRVFLDKLGTHANWETAVHYQLIHALALFGGAIWLQHDHAESRTRLLWATRWWTLGIIFFCGSIYALSVGGPKFLGPITPLGGIALMLGWACVIAVAAGPRSVPRN